MKLLQQPVIAPPSPPTDFSFRTRSCNKRSFGTTRDGGYHSYVAFTRAGNASVVILANDAVEPVKELGTNLLLDLARQ